MALNPTSTGTSIAAYVQSNKPDDGTPVTDTQLQNLWIGIMTIIYNDIHTQGVVNVPIPVVVDLVTGIGATTAPGTIS